MTFSERKILNINMFALKKNPHSVYFLQTCLFLQYRVWPSTSVQKHGEQGCQIAVSSEDLINNKDSDLRSKLDK